MLLADAEQAFRPISPVSFALDRIETNPRFASITRPANAAPGEIKTAKHRARIRGPGQPRGRCAHV